MFLVTKCTKLEALKIAVLLIKTAFKINEYRFGCSQQAYRRTPSMNSLSWIVTQSYSVFLQDIYSELGPSAQYTTIRQNTNSRFKQERERRKKRVQRFT